MHIVSSRHWPEETLSFVWVSSGDEMMKSSACVNAIGRRWGCFEKVRLRHPRLKYLKYSEYYHEATRVVACRRARVQQQFVKNP